jgi:hypothetical protein
MLLQTDHSDEAYIEGTPIGHHAPVPITRLQQDSRRDGVRAMLQVAQDAGEARSRDRIRNEQVGINVERSFQCLSSDDHHSDAMADRAKYSELRTINVSEV